METSKVTADSQILVLKILWMAMLGSQLMIVALAFFLSSQNPEAVSNLQNFAQAANTSLFRVLAASAVICLVLSRYLPGFLFQKNLEKLPRGTKVEGQELLILQKYAPGFILGLALLEAIVLMGFVFFMQYKFMPLLLGFFIFSFLNSLIRFPSKYMILKKAEEVLDPHKELKVY